MHRVCGFPNCTKSATVEIEGCAYCITHFIEVCYKHLEKSLELTDLDNEVKARTRRLAEIVDKVTSISLNSIAFTNQERSQLTDILLWTCDLLGKQTYSGNGFAKR
jgi:hypothetical protein